MPAVGLALLLTMMMKKDMWIFLLIGFVLSAYLKVPTLGVALLGAAAAGVYDLIIHKEKDVVAVASATDEEEGEYDL